MTATAFGHDSKRLVMNNKYQPQASKMIDSQKPKKIFSYEEPAMLGDNHDLFHELPEYADRINQLRAANDHFARLFDEYHQVNSEVERIEENNEGHADFYVEALKKRRLHLKDDLYAMLRV